MSAANRFAEIVIRLHVSTAKQKTAPEGLTPRAAFLNANTQPLYLKKEAVVRLPSEYFVSYSQENFILLVPNALITNSVWLN